MWCTKAVIGPCAGSRSAARAIALARLLKREGGAQEGIKVTVTSSGCAGIRWCDPQRWEGKEGLRVFAQSKPAGVAKVGQTGAPDYDAGGPRRCQPAWRIPSQRREEVTRTEVLNGDPQQSAGLPPERNAICEVSASILLAVSAADCSHVLVGSCHWRLIPSDSLAQQKASKPSTKV